MTTKGRFAAILVALTIFGCKGPVQTSAASSGDGAVAGSSGEGANAPSSSGGGTRVEYIKDPTLNDMNAIPVTIPATWKFRGILFQPGNCVSKPYSVWRATSQDGRSFLERMPVLGWVWGSGPMIGFTPKDGCLPLKGATSAQDFAKYVSANLQVQYVADDPVSAEENAALQKDAGQRHETAEGARATVRYMNGTIAMKGSLKVVLRCTRTETPAARGLSNYSPGQPVHVVTVGSPSTVNHCEANITYLAGPENQFAGLVRQWSVPGMGSGLGTEAWQDAWTQRTINRVQQQTRAFIDASNARFNAQQDYYRRAAVVQQQMHEQFLSTMQAGTDASMAHAAQVANSNHTIASDWVDYSLDRQTVMDTNTGETGKISNQVTPGGSLQKVHGDGTPIQ